MTYTEKYKSKQGFTIIEVVLVLAIAGLIFLMVFLALPALQRSQRDTQRDNDLARLQTALINYKTNNRGKLPSGVGDIECTDADISGITSSAVIASTEPVLLAADDESSSSSESSSSEPVSASCSGDWGKFYKNYLLAGGRDVFNDPSGEPYKLNVVAYSDSVKSDSKVFTGNENTLFIVTKGTCEGESVVEATGRTMAAMYYPRESGGVKCLNT